MEKDDTCRTGSVEVEDMVLGVGGGGFKVGSCRWVNLFSSSLMRCICLGGVVGEMSNQPSLSLDLIS